MVWARLVSIGAAAVLLLCLATGCAGSSWQPLSTPPVSIPAAANQEVPTNEGEPSASYSASTGATENTNQGQASDQKEEKASSYTLKVGVNANNAPFSYVSDSGELVGLDVDLAYLVCRDLGWQVELVSIDWAQKSQLLEQGTVTCLWSSLTKEGREKEYTLSSPYYADNQVVLVKAGTKINSKADLNNKSLSVQKDSTALAALQMRSGGQMPVESSLLSLRIVENIESTFALLDEGVIDAVACDQLTAQKRMYEYPDAYRVAMTLYSENYAVGFARGDDELAAKVNESLARLNKKGVVQELCWKYAALGITYSAVVL